MTLPLNLSDLRITVPPPGRQPVYSPAEVKAMLQKLGELSEEHEKEWARRLAANEKRCPSMKRKMQHCRNGAKYFKMAVLLMLNTGATQQDLADLRHDEVDWTEGRIIRRRSKSKRHPTTPVVNYKLWPETFKLLKEFRSNDPVLALVNEKGTPLKSSREEGGKLKTSDILKCLQFRLIEHLPMFSGGKSLKTFRKTGATQLKAMGADIELRELYLGHAPASVREIHYEQDSPEFLARFDVAIAKLGATFGLTE
jgi:integrase